MTEGLLDQLGDEDFNVREQTQQRIAACCTDTSYLTWLEDAPHYQSPDAEIARRMKDAVDACADKVDACRAVGGGTLEKLEVRCLYDGLKLGAQEEPWRECGPSFANPSTFNATYRVTCAVTDAVYSGTPTCPRKNQCPDEAGLSTYDVSYTSAVPYPSLAACQEAPPNPAMIDFVLAECRPHPDGDPTGFQIWIDVEACRNDGIRVCL